MAACRSCGATNASGARFCNACGAALGASPSAAGVAERKVITALFCDLVGSTELADGADPEDIDRLLRTYHGLAKHRIETYGGSVEKFIGDAVVGVFGVPAAHEDDAERAVRAGLRLIEEVGASGLGVHLRIGVMTGETLVRGDLDPGAGEGIATGDTLNIAARLQSHAAIDGVLVGDATHRACRPSFIWEDAGLLDLKGRAEPLRAWRVLAPVARGSSELIEERTPFVGRESELETLVRLFERARSTPALEVVTVVGDPGMGKSRLVREFARSVDDLPEVVAWRSGRCLPYGDGIAYAALSEIVKAHAGILDTDDQAAIGAKLDAVLTEPDPGLRAWLKANVGSLVGLERLGEAGGQGELFTAWRRFLEQIARSRPLVLVVEDLHWADATFVEFLGELATKSAGLPLLILVTARPDLEQRHPAWFARSRRAAVLSLSALPAAAMQALAVATLPDADEAIRATVLDRAAGSPLFAEQLAALLREHADVWTDDGARSSIPDSIQALLAARIDDLPAEERAVLRDAAVIGRTFWAGAIVAIGDRETGDTESHLAALIRRELVRPVAPSSMAGEMEFSIWHALVRDVAYAGLPRSVRAHRHARFARWLEGTAPDRVEEVAHHYATAYDLAAASRDDSLVQDVRERAVRALLLAGDRALDVDARVARDILERAAAFAADGSLEQARALAAKGQACTSLALHKEASSAYSAAVRLFREHGELAEAADALGRLGHAYYRLGDVHGVEMWDEAFKILEGLPPSPQLLTALARKVSLLLDRGQPDAGIALVERGIRIADELGIAAPAQILLMAGWCRCAQGDRVGLGQMRRAIESSVERNDGWGAAAGYNNTAVSVVLFDGPKAALELLEAGFRWADTRGIADARHFLGGTEAEMRFLSGEWDAALAAVERVEDELDEAEANSLLTPTRSVAAGIRADRGEAAEIRDWLDWLDRAVLGMTQPEWIVKGVAATTAAWVALGEHELAVLGLERLATEADATMLDEGWAAAFPNCCRTAIAEGRPDIVRRLLDRYAPLTPYGRLARASAEAVLFEADGLPREAADRFAQAVGGWRDLGVVPELAHAHAGLGRCLIALGELEDGASRLQDARTIWESLAAVVRLAEVDVWLASAQGHAVGKSPA